MISSTYESLDHLLVYKWCTSDCCCQFFHRFMSHSGRCLDVETLGCRHVFVPQNTLDRGVFHSQLLEVRCETATVGMPALPLQAMRFEYRLDDTVRKIVEVQCPSHAIREDEPGSVFRLDRVEQ